MTWRPIFASRETSYAMYDPVPPADWARYKTDLCRKLMPYAEASQAA